MACRSSAVAISFLMAMLCIGDAHLVGRKVLQASRSSAFTGATTAAMTQTQANIQKAVAISDQPGTPAVQAANPRPANPNPKGTSQGTVTAGKQEAQQAAAQAKIEGEVRVGKVTKPAQPAAKAADVPAQVAKMTAGAKTANTGRATNMQSKTAAGITDAIARQEAVAAINAQPGPNVPQSSVTGRR